MDTLECSNDVLVGFAESLKVFPGLLAVAVVSGAFLGFVVVLLLYGHFLKPEIVTSKVGYICCSRQLLMYCLYKNLNKIGTF